MSTKHKKWLDIAPTNCGICDIELTEEQGYDFFVDGRIAHSSTWAIMCPYCHYTRGTGLGTGYGQKYDINTLKKIEG